MPNDTAATSEAADEQGDVYDVAELFIPDEADYETGVVPMVGWDLAADVMFGIAATENPDRLRVIVNRPPSCERVTTWSASRDQVRDYAQKLLTLVNGASS